MAAAESQVSLKLLIDTKGQRVLFAEADKKAIDFLFHILTLPISTVIKLLSKQQMVGCIANLYESIGNLNETYVQTDQTKDILLKPHSTPVGFPSPLLALPQAHHNQTEKVYYRCNSNSTCRTYVSDASGTICPNCGGYMTGQMRYVLGDQGSTANVSAEGGFVKGVVTYMVMDDLVVQPMSTISSITMLNKFNVKEVGALQENIQLPVERDRIDELMSMKGHLVLLLIVLWTLAMFAFLFQLFHLL